MWPKGLRSLMMGPLRDEETEGGGGGDKEKPVSDKIKLGDKEYDPKSLQSAASLYEALQDEETGTEIIRTLAKRAGLLDAKEDLKVKEGETKKQAESRIARTLKAKLGKDYEKFSDTVGPALEEAIEEMLNERFNSSKNDSLQQRWNDSVDEFIEDAEPSEEIQNTMRELMEDTPPNMGRKGFDAQKYLTRIYKMALNELEIEAPKSKKSTTSRRRNANEDDGPPEFVVRDRPKGVISLDDAVEAAMKGIRFKPRG